MPRGVEALRPEHRHQRQRDQETGESEDVGSPADRVFVLLWKEQENERAHKRREEDDRKYMTLHKNSSQLPLATSFEPRASSNPFTALPLAPVACKRSSNRSSQLYFHT